MSVVSVCVCVYIYWVCIMSFMCLSIVCECGLCVCVAHAYAHLCVFREARRGLQYPALSHLPFSFETRSLSEPGASFFTRVLETKRLYGCEVYAVILNTEPSLLPHI